MVPSRGHLALCRRHGGFVPPLSSLSLLSLCATGDKSLKRRCPLGLGGREGHERGMGKRSLRSPPPREAPGTTQESCKIQASSAGREGAVLRIPHFLMSKLGQPRL